MNERLLYTKPAKNWNEALPLGNGKIGAMVFGRVSEERIALNEDTLWSGYPKDKNVKGAHEGYKRAKDAAMRGDSETAQEILFKEFLGAASERYLALGNLNICFHHEGEPSDYRRILDLSRAVASVSYVCDGAEFSREVFVSKPDSVMVVKISSSKAAGVSFDLKLDSQLLCETEVFGDKYILRGICPTQSDEDSSVLVYSDRDCEKGMTFSCVCSVKLSGGTKKCSAQGIAVENAHEATVFFAAATSFNGFDKHPYTEGREHLCETIEILNRAEEKEYAEIADAHVEDFRSLYDRCEFALETENRDHVPTDERLCCPDDGLFQLIYNFGKYLLVSSSRSGSTATNLQGIWNDKLAPPWRSNYTMNINTQMNYWPVLTCGMTELSEHLDDLIYKLYINGQKTAREHYDAPGFVSHHNSDIWGHTVPVSGSGPVACTYAYWNMSAGWLCRHLFEKYEYTEDMEYLRDFAYPIMKSAAEFCKSLLEEYEGKLIVPMSTSPENRFVKDGEPWAVAKTAAMTQSIVFELIGNTAKAAEILDCDAALREELESILPRLATPEVGSKGQLLEWDEEYEEFETNHRHTSHLYALYPSRQIKFEDKRLADACKKTLEMRGDDGTGWSLSWKLCFYARLRDSKKALKLLKRQLRPVETEVVDYTAAGGTYANLFDAHPPFQIDGNFGIMAGINEMLCQFEDEKVVLLPAVPDEWHSGSFKNLRGPHGFCVSAIWKDGRIAAYTIRKGDRILRSEESVAFGTEILLDI